MWWAKRHPQSDSSTTTPTSPTVVNIPDASIDSIAIQKNDASAINLERKNGKWAITAPAAFPADQDVANGVVTSLSPVMADSVVEDKPTDVSKYGLNAPSLTGELSTRRRANPTKSFSATMFRLVRSVYAQHKGDPKVYTLSFVLIKTSLDKSVNDLRDKRLLTFDTNQLTRIELASAKTDAESARTARTNGLSSSPNPIALTISRLRNCCASYRTPRWIFRAALTMPKKRLPLMPPARPSGQ